MKLQFLGMCLIAVQNWLTLSDWQVILKWYFAPRYTVHNFQQSCVEEFVYTVRLRIKLAIQLLTVICLLVSSAICVSYFNTNLWLLVLSSEVQSRGVFRYPYHPTSRLLNIWLPTVGSWKIDEFACFTLKLACFPSK